MTASSVRRSIIIAIIWATALTLWPFPAWAEEADTPGFHVRLMFESMSWCLPSTAKPGQPWHDDVFGDEWLPVSVETRGFSLMWTEPHMRPNYLAVKHPEEAQLRIGFSNSMPGPADEAAIFIQLAVGCFALSEPVH